MVGANHQSSGSTSQLSAFVRCLQANSSTALFKVCRRSQEPAADLIWIPGALSQRHHKVKADNVGLVVSEPLPYRPFHVIPRYRFAYVPFRNRKTQPRKSQFVLDSRNHNRTKRLPKSRIPKNVIDLLLSPYSIASGKAELRI